jgi:hypothetical protein
MKTNIYNNKEHTEGYTGPEDKNVKNPTDNVLETTNNNKVVSYGKEEENMIKGNVLARDGYDNSGTQGKDSLSDDTYKEGNIDSNP